MAKMTDIPERIMAALERCTTVDTGLTVAEVAKVLREKERTVRDHLDALVTGKKLVREHQYRGTPVVGAFRYFRGSSKRAAVPSRRQSA